MMKYLILLDGVKMLKLMINICSLKLRNPTMLASGIIGVSGSLLKKVALEGGAGAIVTKSLTYKPRNGYQNPVIIGTKCGFINAIGLANQGYEEFLKEELPIAKESNVPIIVSLAGESLNEFKEMALEAQKRGADAIELNLSCPHVEKHGFEIGNDPELVYNIIKELKKEIKIPIFAKIGLMDNLKDVAIMAEKAGADAITAINTIKAMAINIHSFKPILSNIFGGLSGPAIHPIAIRCVYELYETVKIPIIGVGGIENWIDAIEFFLAGASAIQIGSAIAIKGIEIFKEIINGLEEYLEKNGFKKIDEIVGLAHKK
jgi:dihydroorotate dehydrogenase (NAD+) catalytic subunit